MKKLYINGEWVLVKIRPLTMATSELMIIVPKRVGQKVVLLTPVNDWKKSSTKYGTCVVQQDYFHTHQKSTAQQSVLLNSRLGGAMMTWCCGSSTQPKRVGAW